MVTKLQYIPTGTNTIQNDSLLLKWNYLPLAQSPAAIRLITGLTLFGLMLRQDEATSHMRYQDLQTLVTQSIDTSQWQQVQLARLIQKAAALQTPQQTEKNRKKYKKRAG